MPRRRPQPAPTQPAFGALVAQWRLHLRTEVKKASALPSAVFDACDPMVETRLAEAAESMLACLHEPAPRLTQPAAGEQRIERVAPAELRQLPRLVQDGAVDALSVDDGLRAEYFAVLIDMWSQPGEGARAAAARLLARDFQPDAAHAADSSARELWACTQALLNGAATTDARLAELCQQIAASAIGATTATSTDGTSA